MRYSLARDASPGKIETMTTKRTVQSESVSTGSAPSGTRKPRRTNSIHSSKPSAAVAPAEEPPVIDTEAIARLAYSLYEARGYIGGSAEEDWLRAERELMDR